MGAYGKEDFDSIFQVLPELKASNFDLPFSKEGNVASGLVTSFLDNYRGAENARILQVTLHDWVPIISDIKGLMFVNPWVLSEKFFRMSYIVI